MRPSIRDFASPYGGTKGTLWRDAMFSMVERISFRIKCA